MKYHQPAKPGTKLAGYNVLAEIGKGAASIIYLVQDPKTKRIWALKHVEKLNPKDQRFLDQAASEYQVAQAVKSEHVRHIERLIKGRIRLSVREVFLLMEYVDGVSLEKHPPATFDGMLDAFIQTAEGLAYMHAKGYVHADMKPNNVVINEDGIVKIIDLGQACPVGTVKERIQGTPDYIAPEQVHREAITPQTDVYNLGASLYWVLTQRHIPTVMSSQNESLAGPVDASMLEKATPPKELNPRVPEDLSDLVMWCVEPMPARRPQTMDEVVRALRTCREALAA